MFYIKTNFSININILVHSLFFCCEQNKREVRFYIKHVMKTCFYKNLLFMYFFLFSYFRGKKKEKSTKKEKRSTELFTTPFGCGIELKFSASPNLLRSLLSLKWHARRVNINSPSPCCAATVGLVKVRASPP